MFSCHVLYVIQRSIHIFKGINVQLYLKTTSLKVPKAMKALWSASKSKSKLRCSNWIITISLYLLLELRTSFKMCITGFWSWLFPMINFFFGNDTSNRITICRSLICLYCKKTFSRISSFEERRIYI